MFFASKRASLTQSMSLYSKDLFIGRTFVSDMVEEGLFLGGLIFGGALWYMV